MRTAPQTMGEANQQRRMVDGQAQAAPVPTTTIPRNPQETDMIEKARRACGFVCRLAVRELLKRHR